MKRLLPAFAALISLTASVTYAADVPVAKVGDVTLTDKQMMDEMSMSLYTQENQLYNLKRDWINRQARTILFDKAAKTAGLSRKVWEKKTLKTEAPTSQEIDGMVRRMAPPNQMPTDPEKVKDMRKKATDYLVTQKKATKENEVYQQLASATPIQILLTPPTAPAINIPAHAPVKGPADAPVTIFEFTDFECPWCKRSQDSVKAVEQAFAGKVRLVNQMYPLPMHSRAFPAAEAAYCAKDQGKYWEYRDKVFESSPQLADPDFKRIAKELGLKEGKFNACLANHTTKAHVDADLAAGQAFGVKGTPAFYVNGAQVGFQQLMAAVQTELDKKK